MKSVRQTRIYNLQRGRNHPAEFSNLRCSSCYVRRKQVCHSTVDATLRTVPDGARCIIILLKNTNPMGCCTLVKKVLNLLANFEQQSVSFRAMLLALVQYFQHS
jgi:hypothetical protein